MGQERLLETSQRVTLGQDFQVEHMHTDTLMWIIHNTYALAPGVLQSKYVLHQVMNLKFKEGLVI